MNYPAAEQWGNSFRFVVIVYVIYEFAQPYFPKGVFDWKDIYGTLIGEIYICSYFTLHKNVFKK